MAGTNLFTYSADSVIVQLGSFPVLPGKPDGTFLTITMPDLYRTVSGPDSTTRARVGGHAEGELTLMASSPTWDLISSQIRKDSLGVGVGVFRMTVKDLSGTTLIVLPQCYFTKLPDIEFAHEVSERTVPFHGTVDYNQTIIGGSTAVF